MSKASNENIMKVLRLTREMMVLADIGDADREDTSCGVLYGILRDSAYRIRSAAKDEQDLHRRMGTWDGDKNDSLNG